MKEDIVLNQMSLKEEIKLEYLFHLYANKVDSLLIFDNSKPESELIAEKEIENERSTIHNSQEFNKLKTIFDEQ